MNEKPSIECFIRNPSLLIELCREVIDEIDTVSSNTDFIERETQLLEISKTIERLGKAGVAIPDALRHEKIRLITAVAVQADAKSAMKMYVDEFEKILIDLKERLGYDQAPSPTPIPDRHIQMKLPNIKPRKSHIRPHSAIKPGSIDPKDMQLTSMKVIREHIISVLKNLGGSAHANEVHEEISRQMDGKLFPGDLKQHASTKQTLLQMRTGWERFNMTKEGILRNDSPRGVWELSEEYK